MEAADRSEPQIATSHVPGEGTTIVVHLPNVGISEAPEPVLDLPETDDREWVRSPHRLLTFAEAKQFLSVGRTKLTELVDGGEIRTVHIGRSHRFPLGELERFVDGLLTSTERHTG